MNRVATVLLLAMLGMAACGADVGSPALPASDAPPPWAKVAPEQIAEAKKHDVPVAFENDLGMRFVLIPAGTFLMGSPDGEQEPRFSPGPNPEAQHTVRLTKPCYMQFTEVTNAQYRHLQSNHRSLEGFERDLQPVACASWDDAVAFAKLLSERDGERTYRLPTEAEWEYSCRAGMQTPFWHGLPTSTDRANYDGRSWSQGFSLKGTFRGRTTSVGTLQANGWGLYDMHGNVREWCLDFLGDYPTSEVTDPPGPRSGLERVQRGGAYDSRPTATRSAHRTGSPPTDSHRGNGFRLVSPLPEPKSSK